MFPDKPSSFTDPSAPIPRLPRQPKLVNWCYANDLRPQSGGPIVHDHRLGLNNWITVLGLEIHPNSPLPLLLDLLGFGFVASPLSRRCVGFLPLQALCAIVWSGSWNVPLLPSSATCVNLSAHTLSHPNISSPHVRDDILLQLLAPRFHHSRLFVSRCFAVVRIRAVGLSLPARRLNLLTLLRP